MGEQRSEAAELEQRYVAGEQETEELVEGLDPARTRDDQSVDKVAGVSDESDGDVETMAGDDP